jgi:hypothetical protein
MKENILEYKGYIATVSYSPFDEVFYGKVFGINDLVSFEADSAKALKTAFYVISPATGIYQFMDIFMNEVVEVKTWLKSD